MSHRTVTIFKSSTVLLQDIYVNSSSSSGNPARNTDGADTIFSDNIHFDRWTVVNGDDSISMKANSTNILITNSTFYNGLGVAIGSIGQYKGVYERIENVTATDVVFHKTLHGGYVKTWTGEQVNYPPNGGGGGLGCEYFVVNLCSGSEDSFLRMISCEEHHIRKLLVSFLERIALLYHSVYDVFRYTRKLFLFSMLVFSTYFLHPAPTLPPHRHPFLPLHVLQKAPFIHTISTH